MTVVRIKEQRLDSSHSEYNVILLNIKCFIFSLKKVQSKNVNIGACEISKTSLSCFDNKIHILNCGYDGLALDYYGYLLKNGYLSNY